MAMLIDVDKVIHNLHNEIDNCTEETSPFPNTVRKLVQNTIDYLRKQPTVDAVEVVRCKDCKDYHKNTCPLRTWAYTKPDDFCSYGERKDNE